LIGLSNRDSSFFEVIAPDLESNFRVLTSHIISFTVEEEIGQMLSGSIRLIDPDHIYSRIFRNGCKLICSWGYKKPDISGINILTKNTNIFGVGYRQKVTGYVRSPGGGGGSNGLITYNVNFYGSEMNGIGSQTIHQEATKKDVVSVVLDNFGIKKQNQYINFALGDLKCTEYTRPVQTENDFRFLLRCSKEWNAIFKIGQNSRGELLGLFSEFGSKELEAFTKECSGATTAGSITLDYKTGSRNVKEYLWKNNMGMDGTGDNVQIVMINGQAVFHRYNAKTETVETWKLNPDKIEKALRDPKKTSAQQMALMKDWMSAKIFKEVEWAFTPSKDTTAPQGAGYSMEAKLLGNAHVTAGIEALFGDYVGDAGGGFPDAFQTRSTVKGTEPKKRVKWWVTKASHTVDANGYNMDLEIVDAFTINGGSQVG